MAFGDGLEFNLRFYVDDVRLSHFTRASSTANQIRLDVLRLLGGMEPPIGLSTPQLELSVNARTAGIYPGTDSGIASAEPARPQGWPQQP